MPEILSIRSREIPALFKPFPNDENEKQQSPNVARRVSRGTLARNYSASRETRFTGNWISSNRSADSLLASELPKIRGRSRALVRDNPYAKRAKQITVNNVIGSGIGLQSDVRLPRGNLMTRLNDSIESAFEEWSYADYCHTGGRLCFADMERLLMGEIFETGEAFIRLHFSRFGDSRVPLALEYMEPERIADEFSTPINARGFTRVGMDLDSFGRPTAYYFHTLHPGESQIPDTQIDRLEKVDASLIIHLYVCTRWPQHRGEPWLHATARRLFDMDGYSEAEIVAARSSASYMGFIKRAAPIVDDPTQRREITLAPGVIEELGEDEEFISHSPNRPNAQLDPFMRYMLREVAAGSGSSYESLSRDYSQSNYSSSRLSLLDDRDHWKAIQSWFIRSFRQPLHNIWMQQAVLAGAIDGLAPEAFAVNRQRYTAAKFKPRGWSWIDPTKEVQAYKEAIRAGFTTVSRVIAQTGDGLDLEDVLRERRRELDLMEEMGLEFDTEFPSATEVTQPEPTAEEMQAQQQVAEESRKIENAQTRLAEFERRIAPLERSVHARLDALESQKQIPEIHISPVINVPERSIEVAPSPINISMPERNINIAQPEVNIDMAPADISISIPERSVTIAPAEIQINSEAPVVNVAVPERSLTIQPAEVHVTNDAPVVNLTVPERSITVAPADVRVDVGAPVVNMNQAKRTITKHKRDKNGELLESVTEHVEDKE